MKLHFLQALSPLTKAYKATPQGIEKTSYPHMFEVTSHEENVKDLGNFETVLKDHAKKGHCLLKGELQRPLVSESRAGSTDRNAITQWICLDLDGLPISITTPTNVVPYDIDALLEDMGLGDVSYVLQWSASHGIMDERIRAHVFMMLDKPVAVALLKQWLIQLNHRTPTLQSNTTLTKTGCSLSWVLDITACQNDKLIYVAPPKLIGLKDPFAKTPRISLVKRSKSKLTFPAHTNSIATNRDLTDKRIHELREQAGLPKRKITYKMVGTNEVMVKPDAAIVTEMKTERGFVYFNLNGGDSWAYYHPENCPDYIYSFKGEGPYLTKELMPDYWAQLCSQPSRTDSNGITYLAFCDRKTSTYWRGTYDLARDNLEIYAAKNETMLRHFAGQYGMPLAEDIPEWDMAFDPHDSVRVDFDNRTINTFQLTTYMKATTKKVTKCPPTVFKVIHHALGGGADITEHFINWVAFILQERDRTKTAWVLHGTQGTGKGILMNNILRPIFGANQAVVKRMEEFTDRFNGWIEQAFIVFVDEVQTKTLMNERGVIANLKNYITEPTISVRNMFAGSKMVRNYANLIFASNMPDPVAIDREDRRFNVGKYQPVRLLLTDLEIAKIETELQAFHDFLLNYPVDKHAASTPMETEDRSQLISISESSLDATASALLDGDMQFFVDQLPTSDAYNPDAKAMNRIEDYKTTLRRIIGRTSQDTGRCNVARDELQSLFRYCADKVPDSPNKFTSMLKHHRIHTKRVSVDGKTVHGLKVNWANAERFDQLVTDHFVLRRTGVKT